MRGIRYFMVLANSAFRGRADDRETLCPVGLGGGAPAFWVTRTLTPGPNPCQSNFPDFHRTPALSRHPLSPAQEPVLPRQRQMALPPRCLAKQRLIHGNIAPPERRRAPSHIQ